MVIIIDNIIIALHIKKKKVDKCTLTVSVVTTASCAD